MSVVRPEDEEGAVLPSFSLRELQLRKADSRNAVSFGAPPHASVLLRVLRPKAHAYEERDRRWLHLLQAVAAVPSRRIDTMAALVRLALQLQPSPAWRRRLDAAVRATLTEMTANGDFPKRALAALHLKERVAQFLREWIADPVEGFVLWKEHVVAGLRLDDLVATPAGAGYLRGYRREDGFCVVVYPWGHGFVQLQHVARLEQAIAAERKKRKHNEFLVLEHQHLYEDVESLLENYPPESADSQSASEERVALTPEGVSVDEYEKLVASLQDEEPFEAEVLQRDLNFVRRVQALAAKTKHQHEHERQQQQQQQQQHAGGGKDHRLASSEAAGDDPNLAEEEEKDDDVDSVDENRNLLQVVVTPQPPRQDEKPQLQEEELPEVPQEEDEEEEEEETVEAMAE
ncbi:hypothetical protein PybrP1_005784 [[Pythium] brassicae (nom. inval.)]|nr:hypothetical protein PybrP1_005784 [[Pythium] brassicae (nom. inval.)]